VITMIRRVDVHPEMLDEQASLVEDQVGDRQRAQRVADGFRLDVEAPAPLRLSGEHVRNHYSNHGVTSTERIGGKCLTPSTHLSPSVSAKNEPLWVPKYSDCSS